MSLDVSYNQLVDLIAFTDVVSSLPKLKVLNAYGNPIAVNKKNSLG